MRKMKEDVFSSNRLNDHEASEQELKGVVYTAISFLSFLLLTGCGIFYLLW